MPASQEIKASEVTQAMEEPLTNMLTGIKKIYEKTPPQLASYIIAAGIMPAFFIY